MARSFPTADIEVIPGVEITTELDGRELHLLGYFVKLDHRRLVTTLDQLCERRRERFHAYISELSRRGYTIPADRARLVENASASPGRRHVAGLLLECGLARTQNEVFHRMLAPLRDSVIPKHKLAIDEAIQLVHEAGGVASLAHPPSDLSEEAYSRLQAMRLDAIEVEYAWGRSARPNRLRELAARFGFAMTGGSDCHGPNPKHRHIGSYAIAADSLEHLRERCSRQIADE